MWVDQKVSLWADRSGNGFDLTQTDEANMPRLQHNALGGLPAVMFDSTDLLSRSSMDSNIFGDSELVHFYIVEYYGTGPTESFAYNATVFQAQNRINAHWVAHIREALVRPWSMLYRY